MSTPRLNDLLEIETAVWRELGSAVRVKVHGWRTGVLATVDGASGDADARTVVLREFDAESRALFIFTDARSVKAVQVVARPRGTLVLWCPTLGWQLRLRLQLDLATAGLQVSARWARLKMTPAAQDYLSPLPPGAPLGQLDAVLATPAERDSRNFFAVLEARIHAMDWLELHPLGHRRAVFEGADRRWVTP
jgi:hypothetical protein